VHCRSGARSATACAMLEQMGFTQTKNLTGGILAWNALVS
jgi:rhodanese-related sulfurtransferase